MRIHQYFTKDLQGDDCEFTDTVYIKCNPVQQADG